MMINGDNRRTMMQQLMADRDDGQTWFKDTQKRRRSRENGIQEPVSTFVDCSTKDEKTGGMFN